MEILYYIYVLWIYIIHIYLEYFFGSDIILTLATESAFSKMVTSYPRSAKWNAVPRPITPAPSIITDFLEEQNYYFKTLWVQYNIL